MTKIKIGKGYFQKGYGKGFNKTATIYLIGDKLYARNIKGWRCDFEKLNGELEGYVRVNFLLDHFFQVSLPTEHKIYN